MPLRALVLDANILIRAVLGQRVRALINQHAANTRFFAPVAAYEEAHRHLPDLLEKRHVSRDAVIEVLIAMEAVVAPLGEAFYADMRAAALQRIGMRDPDDWPVLACALVLDCPVWTEDTDFFGTGVATWTTDRVELYLG